MGSRPKLTLRTDVVPNEEAAFLVCYASISYQDEPACVVVYLRFCARAEIPSTVVPLARVLMTPTGKFARFLVSEREKGVLAWGRCNGMMQ